MRRIGWPSTTRSPSCTNSCATTPLSGARTSPPAGGSSVPPARIGTRRSLRVTTATRSLRARVRRTITTTNAAITTTTAIASPVPMRFHVMRASKRKQRTLRNTRRVRALRQSEKRSVDLRSELDRVLFRPEEDRVQSIAPDDVRLVERRPVDARLEEQHVIVAFEVQLAVDADANRVVAMRARRLDVHRQLLVS